MHLAQIVEQMCLVRFGDGVDNIIFADACRFQLFKQQLGRQFQFLGELFNVHAVLLALGEPGRACGHDQ
jgi:hypothetical protein